MEYFVIYDLKDNIIAYCDNIDELTLFTNLRKAQLKFDLKNKAYVYYRYNHSYRKIYKFFE